MHAADLLLFPSRTKHCTVMMSYARFRARRKQESCNLIPCTRTAVGILQVSYAEMPYLDAFDMPRGAT